MSGKWTPGPWAIGENGENWFFVVNRHGVPICEMTYSGDMEAANLIAAAPDLFEALDGLIDLLTKESHVGQMLDMQNTAIAALRKARGEA